MNDIPRLPTKFGRGHSEMIADFQAVTQRLIENKIVGIIVVGFTQDGEEIGLRMMPLDRQNQLKFVGLLDEAKGDLCSELRFQDGRG